MNDKLTLEQRVQALEAEVFGLNKAPASADVAQALAQLQAEDRQKKLATASEAQIRLSTFAPFRDILVALWHTESESHRHHDRSRIPLCKNVYCVHVINESGRTCQNHAVPEDTALGNLFGVTFYYGGDQGRCFCATKTGMIVTGNEYRVRGEPRTLTVQEATPEFLRYLRDTRKIPVEELMRAGGVPVDETMEDT
jgi:hypothetical protein